MSGPLKRVLCTAALAIVLIACWRGLRAEPAYTPDELKQLDALLDFACSHKPSPPSLDCHRGAILLYDKAVKAEKLAVPKEGADDHGP